MSCQGNGFFSQSRTVRYTLYRRVLYLFLAVDKCFECSFSRTDAILATIKEFQVHLYSAHLFLDVAPSSNSFPPSLRQTLHAVGTMKQKSRNHLQGVIPIANIADGFGGDTHEHIAIGFPGSLQNARVGVLQVMID